LTEPRAEDLSAGEARRIALAAQGFAQPRPGRPGASHLRKLADRLNLFQIDSVNVVARAHYLPAFARLGGYDPALLDGAAWGGGRDRRLFEYWAHEASLLPLDLHPLLRWRMARGDRGEAGYGAMRRIALEHRPEAMAVVERIRSEGPLAASDLETGRTGWWTWSESKRLLEWLFYAGHVTTRTRRGNFERVYDLPERVIPPEVLNLPTPPEAEAHRALMERSARALGVATAAELRDYFRLKPADAAPTITALQEEGVLVPVKIPGWPAAWRHRDARPPRRVRAQALLAPFDPLVWERGRAERMFGFRYRIEIYTPAVQRTHGYYVLPFLLDEGLVARVDLKADRKAGVLRAHAVHLEPGAPEHTQEALTLELERMAGWLGLERLALPA